MTDSERALMVSYKWFIVSFRLSYTVSDILRLSCKPKMKSSIYLRLVAQCTILNDGILEGDNGFLIVFNSNFISVMHRFRDNEVFLQTENDVINYPPGSAVYSFRRRNCKGNNGFLIAWCMLEVTLLKNTNRKPLLAFQFPWTVELFKVNHEYTRCILCIVGHDELRPSPTARVTCVIKLWARVVQATVELLPFMIVCPFGVKLASTLVSPYSSTWQISDTTS